MSKKVKKAYQILKDQPAIEMPWDVGRFFVEGSRHIEFAGDQLSLGEDYGNLEELRYVVEWLADQLGGKVEWNKTK